MILLFIHPFNSFIQFEFDSDSRTEPIQWKKNNSKYTHTHTHIACDIQM